MTKIGKTDQILKDTNKVAQNLAFNPEYHLSLHVDKYLKKPTSAQEHLWPWLYQLCNHVRPKKKSITVACKNVKLLEVNFFDV